MPLLSEVIKDQNHIKLLDVLMPGGKIFEKYLEDDEGDCKKSCPGYGICFERGESSKICSYKWGQCKADIQNLEILFHVLNNFSYYARGDIGIVPGRNTQEMIAQLRQDIHDSIVRISNGLPVIEQ